MRISRLYKRPGYILVGLGLLGLLTVYGILPVLRAVLVAHPTRKPLPAPNTIPFEYEDAIFATPEGPRIHGWYIPSQSRAAVILVHGYNGNRADYLEPAQVLAVNGYGVLMIDLLAHGESEGETLSFNGAEILAALAYLKTRPEVDVTRIGVWGFSLGGLAGIQAAAQTEAIGAVVADGPFPVAAAQDMPAPETVEDWLWTPFDRVQWAALALYGVAPAMPTIEAIKRIAPRPLLLIAGIENRGERRVLRNYYAEAGAGTELWEVAGAGHVEGWTASRADYEARVLAFFKRILLK